MLVEWRGRDFAAKKEPLDPAAADGFRFFPSHLRKEGHPQGSQWRRDFLVNFPGEFHW